MEIGQTLNQRYTVTARLGKGAMGVVYRATHTQTSQEVAIKVLSRDVALDPALFERFRREGEALRQLRHPNIVGFVDMFEHDEQQFIVMDYVPGGNLHQLIQQGPLPLDRARQITLGLCDALTRAHALDIIHRDIKPENILLAADGTPKLSDFGVARLISDGTRLTGTGTQVGTPYYMAPEAWEGAPLDAQADIWALGVVLYEMLTGQVPFGGETLIVVMHKVLNAPLTDIHQLRPEVPRGLAQIVAGMLTRDKALRYTSMRRVAADLEQGEPTVMRPGPTRLARKGPAVRWPGWVWLVSGLILAGLVVGAILIGPKLVPMAASPTPPTAIASSIPAVVSLTPPAAAPTSIPATRAAPTSAAALPATPPTALPTDLADGQWHRVSSGEKFPAATVNTLAVDPRDAQRILVGTYGSGIYLSTDGGQTWAPANTGLGQGLVSALVFNPQDPDIVYAAMPYQGGVYKSADSGQTWQPANNGIDFSKAWSWTAVVTLDPQDPQRVYYSGAFNGVWLSTNAGQSWTRQGSQQTDCVHPIGLAVDPADGQHLYAASYAGNASPAGCPSGIYGSSDGGLIWQRLSPETMIKDPSAVWSLAVDPRDFNTLYAGGDTGTWKSTDSGQHWTKVRAEACWYIAVSPGDGAAYCVTAERTAVSRDGGQTWQTLPTLALGSGWERHPVAFAPSHPQIMYTGYDRLLQSTDDGQSWQPLGQWGVRRAQVRVDARDSNRLYLILGEKNNPEAALYVSADGGQTWQSKLNNIGAGRLAIDPAQNMVYYVNPWDKNNNSLFRSSDNGQTWENFGSGDLGKSRQLAPDPQNPARLWLVKECGSLPLRSDDSGLTFKEVVNFQQPLCGPFLVIAPSGRRMYIVDGGGFWRSEDGGQNWLGTASPGGDYNTAVVDPSNPDIVYLGSTHLGVQKTSDGGSTWQPASTGLPISAINEIILDPQNPQALYAATDRGAFFSLNGGGLWQPLASGLGPNPIIYSIAVDPNDPHRVFAATADGVFRLAPSLPVP